MHMDHASSSAFMKLTAEVPHEDLTRLPAGASIWVKLFLSISVESSTYVGQFLWGRGYARSI